VARNFVTIN